MVRSRWQFRDNVAVIVCSLLLRGQRLMQLRWWVCKTIRCYALLVWLLHAFGQPSIKHLCHKLHPLWRSPCEVVFDGLVPKGDEVVLFVVR